MTEPDMKTDPHLIAEEEEVYSVFHISRREGILAIGLLVFYILSRFLFQNPAILIIAAMSFAIWLTFRASHFAIDGLESIGALVGLSAYFIGVLSSLASNTPEAVITAFTAWRGIIAATPELIEIAVLSVVMAAGFNIFLLGCVVILSTRKTGVISVPKEVVEDEVDLIRWTIVVMGILFAFGILHYITAIGSGVPPSIISLPPLVGLLMVISYVLYAIYAIKKPSNRPEIKVKPRHTKRDAIILAVLGFVGIFIAGYILTEAIELTFVFVPWAGLGIVETQRIVIMAMIIGAAGAIPEHGIALIAAGKGKVGIAIGNTLGGTTQILLLIIGAVSLILPFTIPLDVPVLLQFAAAAGSLWFLKRALTDDQRVDIYEGAMILLMQVFVFIIVLVPI